jgi:low affinity Fe/Cu permease
MHPQRFSEIVEKYASWVTRRAGNNTTLIIVFLLIFLWLFSGIYLHFSEKWALTMATFSGAVTLIMVFLIQKSQNKDSLAIQLKLNELVAANELASNRLVNVEGMTEEELKVIQKYYSKLRDFTSRQDSLQQSHSIDESHKEHEIKQEMEKELINLKSS